MPKGEIRLRTQEGHLNQVADRMRSRRRVQKLTQEQLCGRLADATEGLWIPARMDIVRIENGARIVSDLEIFALAKALGCTPCWLLAGVNDLQPPQG